MSRRGKVCAIVCEASLSWRFIKEKGIGWLELRQKNVPTTSLVREVKKAKKKLKNCGVSVLVNDRPDAALAAQANGLHVGRGDMPISLLRKILGSKSLIGKTVRSVNQAVLAEKEGYDYLGIGPIFKTPEKIKIQPRGLNILKRIKSRVSIPVVAIGGMNFQNMNRALSRGADAVAMIRGIK